MLPGTATVALLVTDLDREALIAEVERVSGARLVYANLDDLTLERIRKALGEVVLGSVLGAGESLPAPASEPGLPAAPPEDSAS